MAPAPSALAAAAAAMAVSPIARPRASRSAGVPRPRRDAHVASAPASPSDAHTGTPHVSTRAADDRDGDPARRAHRRSRSDVDRGASSCASVDDRTSRRSAARPPGDRARSVPGWVTSRERSRTTRGGSFLASRGGSLLASVHASGSLMSWRWAKRRAWGPSTRSSSSSDRAISGSSPSRRRACAPRGGAGSARPTQQQHRAQVW